jgi:hypothetical protein
MSRPLRIEFPGALHHVTSRGDRREDIFADDTDRARLLAVVAQHMKGGLFFRPDPEFISVTLAFEA